MRMILTSHRNSPDNDGSTVVHFEKTSNLRQSRIMEHSLRVRMTHVDRSLVPTASVTEDPPLNDSIPPLKGRQE
jgi:hypothetical protein